MPQSAIKLQPVPKETPDPKEPSIAVAQAARRRGRPPAAPGAPAGPGHDLLVDETIRRHAEDPDFVTGLARGLAVLLALSEKRRRMSISEVSQRTGIPRAATRRSLHTLSALGFADSDDSRRFYLRPRVLSFSHAYLTTSPLAVLAQPLLDRLGEQFREAFSIATLDGDEIVYLARSSSSRILSPVLNVGRRQPAYCTSVGQLMLAQLPQAEQDAYVERVRFFPITPRTIGTKAELREALDFVRHHDYAFCAEQTELRLCSLAVPVRDVAGHCVAGINVIRQAPVLEREATAEAFVGPLQQAARELGALLIP